MSSILNAPTTPISDEELARRSLLGFGEFIAVMGEGGGSPGAVLRRPGAVGARIDTAADNPWFDAVVVPLGADPPADDALLPLCVWTMADAVPERVEDPAIATPCMGVSLNDPVPRALGRGTAQVEPAPLEVLGEMNERAYGQAGVFGPLVRAIRDERVRSYGVRDGGAFVCVAATLAMGDDLGIYFVATEESHRRRGLASGLLLALLAGARRRNAHRHAAGQRGRTGRVRAPGLPPGGRHARLPAPPPNRGKLMKAGTLLFLRLTIAYLLVIWGADKLANPEHGLAVSRMFYGGLFGGRALMPAYGVAQIALGGLLALGIGRRFLYPAVGAITGTTLLGVWRSVADPWGWYLEGSNVLFYPSAVVFAAVLVLWAWRDQDVLAVGARRARLQPELPR